MNLSLVSIGAKSRWTEGGKAEVIDA